MGKIYDEIDGKLADWIGAQRLFFVATAPSGDGGHVNCSPKGGIETFRILGPRSVAVRRGRGGSRRCHGCRYAARRAASCPQAASMSRPRVRRTVAGRLARSRTALKAAIASRDEAVCTPVGLYGIRFTL